MAELALRDGFTTPSDLPRGDCIMTSLGGGSIRVDHADPRVLISAEVLDNAADHPDDCVRLDLDTCHTYVGSVLKISGVNRRVVYRIVEHVPAVNAYIGQWPD
jgi:hypothetical protein